MSTENDNAWYYEYFADVDTMEIDRLAAWMNDDVVVRFGNQPILHGKGAALAAILEFWKGFQRLEHAHGRVLTSGNYTSGEAVVTFTLHDGRRVMLPGVTILERRNGRISRLGAYLDFAPLYAPPDAGAGVIDPDFFLKAP